MQPLKLSFFALLILISGLVFGCSHGESPITRDANPLMIGGINPFPIGVSDWGDDGSPIAGMGLMGLFNLNIDIVNMSASMEPVRNSALTDVLEVADITNFLQLAPCTDCVKIKSVSLDLKRPY